MQYRKIFSTLIVGIFAGIQACNALSTYGLFADPVDSSVTLNTVFTQLSWVNSANESGIYIGNVKLRQVAEPFIVNYTPDGQLLFLTYHAERYQQWYILKDEVQPVGLALWQGITANFTTTGFNICDGYLRYQEEDNWAVCPSAFFTSSYKLFYVGGDNPVPAGCVAVTLRALEYGFCDQTA